VKIGNLSRGGKSRTQKPRDADDHDTRWSSTLVPFGILNLHSDQLSIYMGQSAETSDFVVDCLTAWWHENHKDYPQLEEWVIDLDGGSATRSNRTQFIKRMVELAWRIGIRIRGSVICFVSVRDLPPGQIPCGYRHSGVFKALSQFPGI
jgi:Rhodopirellula transposase DDE domain